MKPGFGTVRYSGPLDLWMRLAFRTSEMLWASTQVIAFRTSGMLRHGSTPSARDRRELILMGREKVEAAAESATAMGYLLRMNLELASLAMPKHGCCNLDAVILAEPHSAAGLPAAIETKRRHHAPIGQDRGPAVGIGCPAHAAWAQATTLARDEERKAAGQALTWSSALGAAFFAGRESRMQAWLLRTIYCIAASASYNESDASESNNKVPAYLLRVALPVALACALGLPCASADVYAWIEASGTLVLSDVAAPPGARVIDVVADRAPAVSTRPSAPPTYDAARQGEIEFLSERVRLLEREVELAGRQPAPAATYGTVPAQGMNGWCDPAWSYCGLGWGPAIYPGVIVVPRSTGFRGFARFHHRRPFAVPPPARVSKGFHVR